MTAETIRLNPFATALILVDLQNLIVDLPLAPLEGRALVEEARKLALRLQGAGGVVILVRADLAGDARAALHQLVDRPMSHPSGPLPDDWADLVQGLGETSDVTVTKRQWGAFYGTDLDLQLRRRGIETVVIGGIATNFGVESTARQAWEHGYSVVLADDLMTSFSREMHDFAVAEIFSRIGRVRPSASIVFDKSE